MPKHLVTGQVGWPEYPINKYVMIYPDDNNTGALVKDQEYALPLIVSKTQTFDRIGLRHGSAGDGAAVFRIVLRNDGVGKPGTVRIQDTVDATTVGAWKFITISEQLVVGVYWISVIGQGWTSTAPIIGRCGGGAYIWPMGAIAGAHDSAGWATGHNPSIAIQSGITGVATDAFTSNPNTNENIPALAIRRSA